MSEHVTYCRLCEPLCGLIATVENGRLVSLVPDPDNPLSRGFVCPKGVSFTEIQNAPDRLLHPMRRNDAGELEQVSWDEALDEIASRLRTIWDQTGPESIAFYLGNPSAFSYSAALWTGGFGAALGDVKQYTAGSQDTNSRWVASKLLYNAIVQTPFPDLPRTDFLLMLGANPLVSHGGLLRAPRIRQDLADISKRGGRVVVVDPRRTETAKAYEHVSLHPDSDAWLLLSLLHSIDAEGLVDAQAIAEQTTGWESLRATLHRFAPEETAEITGVEPEVVRRLARDFATADRASTYGRTGTCLGRQATLVNALLDAVSIVTGNLDRPGGLLFAQDVIPLQDLAERAGQLGYADRRSRIGDHPDVIGTFPASTLAEEITTPGEGQVRAMFCTAGDPVMSTPDGGALAAALPRLDLLVCIDLFVSETAKYADFVLPAVTFLERDDVPIIFAGATPYPFLQHTEAVVEPYGEARHEWEIYRDIAARAGFALFVPGANSWVTRIARRLPMLRPRQMVELGLRIGPYGDRFGLRRGGLNPKRLREHPHGIRLAEFAPTGLREKVVRHPNARVELAAPQILDAITALRREDDPDFPLRMIGLREMRSLNSWLHRSPTLMKGERRHEVRVHPDDAATYGITDGEAITVTSRSGRIESYAKLTDELRPGTIAVPHGWRGANSNLLTPSDVVEPLAGMSHLNGVPVQIAPGC